MGVEGDECLINTKEKFQKAGTHAEVSNDLQAGGEV